MEDMSIDNDSAFFEEEVSVTHPRCYSSDHVEKLETFAEDLNQALKASFPSNPNPYTSVHVLLLRWTEDDLGVQTEISALRRVFESRFHFDVEEWQIPGVNSTRALQKKLYGFQDAHQNQTELLIVYYGGHAKADSRRGRSIWQAHSQPNSPSLNWSSLQPLLETAVPYVLIILDCCFAATAARDTTEGTTKEILAACGRESPTHGVGIQSFTSALIEEMQAFEGEPFTAAMLHSRLVTMRWRLAFTPIYALLSERGGNSITIYPFADDRAWDRPEPQPLAELEVTNNSQDVQASMTINDSSLSQTSQKQTFDTRVLLTVSVVQDAIHDVSHWVSWLTTAAPWDVTKVDVQVHSVFKSYSTLVIVSVPTYAWDRLPERPAYRFVGFIRSGDDFQASRTTKVSTTETVATQKPLPISPPPSLQSHKRQGTDTVAQPNAKLLRRSSRLPVSGSSPNPLRATSEQDKTPEPSWSAEKDRLLVRARRQGLNWQPIANKYFPYKTANACRKRHERLMERSKADDFEDVDNETSAFNNETLAQVYTGIREQMWKPLAARMGEDWQIVEAKCMEMGLKTPQTSGHTVSRRERSPSYQDEEDSFNDSAIGPEDHPFVHYNAPGHSRDAHQHTSYSSSGYSMPPSYNAVAPQHSFPRQQPQTLPSFSDAFGMPSISAGSNRLHLQPEEAD